jgi:hypothetical protein
MPQNALIARIFRSEATKAADPPSLAALVRSLAETNPEFGSWYKQSDKRRGSSIIASSHVWTRPEVPLWR